MCACQLRADQVFARFLRGQFGFQGAVEGDAAVAEQFAAVGGLLGRLPRGVGEQGVLPRQGGLSLIGGVDFAQSGEEGLVVAQKSGLQAGVGGLLKPTEINIQGQLR